MRSVRRLLASLAVILACAPVAGAQADTAGHHDNVATAITETDGAHVSDFAWGISRQRGGDVVDQLNAAHALASCTDCSATAVAFQIVLVSGSPRTVAPRNIAEAINDRCTRCEVAAEARQFVRVVDQPVRFTAEGTRELADVRRDLRALVSEDISLADLHAAVERDEARVKSILNTELVPTSDPDTAPDVSQARTLQDADLG